MNKNTGQGLGPTQSPNPMSTGVSLPGDKVAEA